MSFFTIGWQPPADIGLLPQHAGDGDEPFFPIGWTPKRSAAYYPYDTGELIVAPGQPDPPPVVEQPAPLSARDPVPPPPVPAPPAVIRPHTARLSLLARKNPRLFRRHGLKFEIALEAPATVSAVLVAEPGGRHLTYTQRRSLRKGTSHMTLHPGAYGRHMTLHHRRVKGRLEVTIAYRDHSKGVLKRSLLLAEAP
jgi:hypothetical protein